VDSGQCSNTGHNDGCHRLYKGVRLGREHLPSLVLTVAETPETKQVPPDCLDIIVRPRSS
jgi:hypothetical protein